MFNDEGGSLLQDDAASLNLPGRDQPQSFQVDFGQRETHAVGLVVLVFHGLALFAGNRYGHYNSFHFEKIRKTIKAPALPAVEDWHIVG